MMRNSLAAGVVVALLSLLTPTKAHAYGVRHVGYTHVGPGGVYHAGGTAAYGRYGAYGGVHRSAYGYGGATYRAGAGAAYRPYGAGYAGGYRYGYAVRGGYYRRY